MILLAVAQGVGGANALIPVIRMLRCDPNVHVSCCVSGKAVQVFREEGIDHAAESLPERNGIYLTELARTVLDRVSPDVLLVGNAWGPSLDKAILALANERNIPSVVVLDMWSVYRERFVDPRTGRLNLPSKLAVMDQLAYREAESAGIPEDRLVITGQPYLESLPAKFEEDTVRKQASVLRQSWLGERHGEENRRIVLFASEAVARDHGPETESFRGYTEVEALDGLIEAVQLVEEKTGDHLVVVVKLHPDEPLESLSLTERARERGVRTVADQRPWPCILAADVVAGMASMFLIESVFAGKPTISFRPGVSEKNSFVGACGGMVAHTANVGDLASVLGACFIEGRGGIDSCDREKQGQILFSRHKGAASKIVKLLFEQATRELKCH